MVLTHFLLTRFSYDSGGARADKSIIIPNHTTVHPLARHRLEKRFTLFELFCLPSVLGQTTRDFIWIVIVDPRLPERDRQRLRDFTRAHPRTRIVNYDPRQELGRLDWLRPCVENPETTHIATTNIDDDDLIGVDFVTYVQRYLRARAARHELPDCQVLGCVKPLQWDLMPTRRAKLGYLKPWHRGNFLSYAGYTICCRQPAYDLSVFAFEHTTTVRYFDPAAVLPDPTQARLRHAAERAGDDWRTWTAAQHVHIVVAKSAQVVVVNHLENDQISRLFERWSTRRPMRGPADLPNVRAAYDRMPAVIRIFRRSPMALCRHLYRGLRVVTSSRSASLAVRWSRLTNVLRFPLWFIVGLPEPVSNDTPVSPPRA